VHVEFNEPHLCWVELRWRAHEDQWQAFQRAPEDLGLEIPITELTAQEVIQILRPDSTDNLEHDYRDGPQSHNTPETAPMHDSSMSEAPEPVQVYDEETPEDQGIRNQAESLHIFNQGVRAFMDAPHICATRTEESRMQTAHIDPNTGRIFDPNAAAAHCAAGPD
jgi:hypothetical protein